MIAGLDAGFELDVSADGSRAGVIRRRRYASPPPPAAVPGCESVEGDGGLRGGVVTPFVLAHIAAASGGRALAANIGLIVNNARMAARVALAVAHFGEETSVYRS